MAYSRALPPFRAGVQTEYQQKKFGVQQALSVSLTSGRRVFVGTIPGAEVSSAEMMTPAYREALNIFMQETILANKQALDKILDKVISTLVPSVALKTGKLRNAITGFLLAIKTSFKANQAIILAGLDEMLIKRNQTITQVIIDFQLLFAQLDYAIFHAVEFRNSDVYANPTTPGTAPYSMYRFYNLFIQEMINEVILFVQMEGWDVAASGMFNIIDLSVDPVGTIQ